MADCEICGRNSKVSKIRINGVLLNACGACSAMGKPIEEHLQRPKKIMPVQSYAEELVVQNYAEIIRKARQKMNIKQEEAALKLKEKLSEYSAVEGGKRVPDLKLAKKLEKFFGIRLVEET